jgi:hypothetical protein
MLGWRRVNKGVDIFNENQRAGLGMRATSYQWYVGGSGIISEFAGEVTFVPTETPRQSLRGPIFCMGGDIASSRAE